MTSMRRFFAAVAVFACFLTVSTHAFDISETIILPRYTILETGSIQLDQGYLLKSGKFKVLLSDILDPIFYDSLEEFEPISGRPVMDEFLYDGYKESGVIPKWTRSRESFSVSFADYVIVAVKGKGDPNPHITISTQPQSQRALPGDWIFFEVEAEPYWYLSYQWYFKGKPIPGENWRTLWITPVTPAHAGIYKCHLSTGGKVVKTKNALLKVVTPVTIKTPPKSQTVKTGKNVTFRVMARGSAPFRYQWYRNGSTITNATNSFYTIRNVNPEHAGEYTVLVNNGPSSAVSVPAVLTVAP